MDFKSWTQIKPNHLGVSVNDTHKASSSLNYRYKRRKTEGMMKGTLQIIGVPECNLDLVGNVNNLKVNFITFCSWT